jgi:hypothetical protein
VLDHFTVPPSPFCSGYFGDRASLLSRLAWTTILLLYSSCYHCDGRCAPPRPAFFCWDGISQTSFTSLAWNFGPPDLSLPNSSGWQGHVPPCPAYWLRWGLADFFAQAGIELQSSWSQPPK